MFSADLLFQDLVHASPVTFLVLYNPCFCVSLERTRCVEDAFFFLSLSRGPCPRRFVLFNQTLHTSGILRLRPLSRLLVLHGLEYNRHILRDVL